jgi:sugar phosphate isomerase/epimerase
MPEIKLGVTLYSFNVEYYTYQYTLEDCMAAVGSLGPGQGVEIVGPQMIRGYPDLPAEFEQRFNRAIEKYDLRPTAYGAYGDAQRISGRWPSDAEQLDYVRRQIRAASRLGFPVIRVQPNEEIFTSLVSYAEKYDVKMAIEIHAPMAIETMEPIIQRVESVNSPYLGFAPDCGPFCHSIADVAIERFLKLGVPSEVVDLIVRRWREQVPGTEVAEEVRAMGGGGDYGNLLVTESNIYFGHSEPASLHRIMPLISHVHGKFFNVNSDGEDSAVRFPEVVEALQKGGYDGYISCEYEGHHWNRDRRAIDQIRTLQQSISRQLG